MADSWLKNPLVWLGGLGVAYFALREGAAGSTVSSAIASAEGSVEAAIGVIPEAARQYLSIISQVAQEEGVDPLLITAIGWRESNWGTASALDQPGPGGTGDFAVRSGSWLNQPNTTEIDTFPLPPGWSIAKSQSLPVVIPADGRGWGRGLMQVDYLAALSINWSDPYTNIKTGAQIWKQKRAYLARKLPQLSDHDLDVAATAAYNAGEGSVAHAISQGDMSNVDDPTTGGDYSASVVGNWQSWASSSAQT